MEIIRYGETCTVKQANKSVKLPMTWNGKLYEGKMAGIDFTSAGPSINKTTSGRG